MNRILLSLFLSLFLVLVFSQQQPANQGLYLEAYSTADEIYQKAGQLSSLPNYTDATEEKEAALNKQALVRFKKILPAIEKAQDDSLAFHCYFKIGVLEHYFDSIITAKQYYAKAITLQSKHPSIPDSFVFQPFLFLGGIQYNTNQYDSALLNFKKAEKIAGKYATGLDGTNRLYNTLGAMYFETANYSQAKNYFSKAITLLGAVTPNSSNAALLVNYQINLAATLTRLEEFDEANSIYQQLLQQDINKNEILHNVGTINLKLGASHKALGYFKQVTYNNNRAVRLLNDIGQAWESMNKPDSARYYYREALKENEKWNPGRKNIQAGLTLKYLGDYDNYINSLNEALKKYQRAIIQFTNDFNETDIYKNPEQFSGVFSYINLFNTLTAKAATFERFYQKVKDTRFLKGSLNTYRAAFRLADYVEKTYDSDEARLFLNKLKYAAHSKPIEVSLLLYELTQQREYLEEAYMFDQRNKASILSLNVQEDELRNSLENNNALFEKESSLRSAITRLSLKAAQITDSLQLQTINASIRDHEIQLGKVQDEIKKDPAYSEKHLAERILPVNEVQKELDRNTALISYHLSENELLALIITDEKFEFSRSPVTGSFFAGIDSLRNSLQDLSAEQHYSGSGVSSRLYRVLLSPVQTSLPGIKKLVIIPDDELSYLPFEALEDEDGKYLIEKFSVQYQYSTALLKKTGRDARPANILAFAPFASAGYKDPSGTELASLPASKEEVKILKGKIFTDSQATKHNFLQTANYYGIIHLATHASVNNEMPQRSFIAFSPAGSKDDYRLYAGEIYDMDLDSTRLIILSACETGAGQLVKGEGLMSLSRAFAYAGCPNIITSLWKAEDKTTAFITQRLHYYLGKGINKDIALQKAKLDLLNSPETDPRFKTPNYWAHLIFIGQYEPSNESRIWWWTIGGSLFTALLIIVLAKLKSRRNRFKLSMID
ncbi:MAG TPA: CHAT domain-containing protein [Chitinophagaceae bacterium]